MKYIIKIVLLLASINLIIACSPSDDTFENEPASVKQQVHPEIDHIYSIHDVDFNDKYNWLSEQESELVLAWEQLQNNNFTSYLEANDFNSFRDSLAIEAKSGYFFTQKLEQHYFSVMKPPQSNGSWGLSVYNAITAKTETIKLTTNPEESIVGLSISTTGRYTALLFQKSQRFQWRVFDTFSKEFKSQNLPWLSHYSNLVWHSSSEYIYTNGNKINLAKVSNSRPKSLFSLELQLENWQEWSTLNFELTHNSEQLYVQSRNNQSSLNKGWLIDITKQNPKEIRELITDIKADLQFVGSRNHTYYFLTNIAAPRNRVISVNLNRPERRHWQEVIPQSSAVLLQAKLVNQEWLLQYRDNAQSRLKLASLNGSNPKDIKVPDYSEISFSKQSFYAENQQLPLINLQSLSEASYPNQLQNEKITSIFGSVVQKNNLYSKLNFYRSKDGSRIPISIFSSDKNINNKSLLLMVNNGYGQNDDYSTSLLIKSFIDLGGTVAIAHVRGGATYGNSWIKAGSGSNKNKAIDDILAAQEWLIDKNLTSPNKLAIYGNELNSTIIAQSLNQSDSQASSVIFGNGHFNLINHLNNSLPDEKQLKEYGYKDNKDSLIQLLKISPFHNIKHKNYPVVLMISDDYYLDNQQYISKLQNYQSGTQALLITKPENSTEIENIKLILYFLKQQLEL